MSAPLPARPTNPSLLIADTSALLQLIISEEVQGLRALRSDYGIQCVITEAVEAEMRRKLEQKFRPKGPVFKKALANNAVMVLEESVLAQAGFRAGAALIEQIEQLGLKYAARIDRGEAYTHAAGNVLGVPTLSQDLVALWKLIDSGIHVHRPVLRAFDVVVFALQIGVLSADDCKLVRKELLKNGESVLECFRNCSVVDGLPSFYQRLCDCDAKPLGALNPIEPFDERIWIRRNPVL